MEKYKNKIITAIIIILVIAYLIILYPLKVRTDEYGETICESLIGIQVGC